MVTYYEGHKEEKGIVMLLLGPIIGLVYVIGLPFIGIAMVVAFLGKKVFDGAVDLLRNVVSFGWRPSEAYLSGKKKKKRRGDA